jgi:hypothetical protein
MTRAKQYRKKPVVIIPIDPCKPMYHVAFTEHGGDSNLLHVIEYAAIEELEAENARLNEALEDQGKLVRRLSEMFKEESKETKWK